MFGQACEGSTAMLPSIGANIKMGSLLVLLQACEASAYLQRALPCKNHCPVCCCDSFPSMCTIPRLHHGPRHAFEQTYHFYPCAHHSAARVHLVSYGVHCFVSCIGKYVVALRLNACARCHAPTTARTMHLSKHSIFIFALISLQACAAPLLATACIAL